LRVSSGLATAHHIRFLDRVRLNAQGYRAWHDAPVAQPNALRTAIDRVSAPALLRLSRLPRAVPFVVMLALLVAGLWVSGVIGCVLILLGVLFLAWLLYIGWPALSQSERLMRLAVVVLGVGLAVVQLRPS
jgi:hypothetical protein